MRMISLLKQGERFHINAEIICHGQKTRNHRHREQSDSTAPAAPSENSAFRENSGRSHAMNPGVPYKKFTISPRMVLAGLGGS